MKHIFFVEKVHNDIITVLNVSNCKLYTQVREPII